MGAIRLQSALNTGNAASLAVGSGQGWAAPQVGSLLMAWANSDATVTIDNSMTAGPSVVDGNGAYIWYKTAAGTESSYTFTFGVSAKGTCGVLEYSGLALTSVFDVSNSTTITGTFGSTTTSTGVTTTNANGGLLIAVAALHGLAIALPNTESWTGGFTTIQQTDTGAILSPDCSTFVAELITGSAGAQATACSWSPANSASDRQLLLIAFDLAAVATEDPASSPVYVGPTRR